MGGDDVITISTHSLTKRLTGEGPVLHRIWTFQLTASRRGWHVPGLLVSVQSIFQLTASRRGWLRCCVWYQFVETFQLTASRRGWPVISRIVSAGQAFQLTASRRGWQLLINFFQLICNISTHSLTKRLTAILDKIHLSKIVFYAYCTYQSCFFIQIIIL